MSDKGGHQRGQRHIDYLALADIQGAPRNAKRHNGPGIGASLGKFGVGELPLLDERTGRLVAGHGRIEQLRQMQQAGQTPPDGVTVDPSGGWLVPVTRGWASRSDMEAEAYLVASNQLTTVGGWDDVELAEMLTDLADADLLGLTGFTDEELAGLLDGIGGAGAPPALTDPDVVPAAPAVPVSAPGDLWLLGPHRVLVGDCRDYSTVERLMAGVEVNVAFTSPPYASQRKYDESSGFKPIPPDEYVDWFEDVQANVRAVLAPDGSWFVNIKENSDGGQRVLYVKDLVTSHVRRWGWLWAEEMCWLRSGMPGLPESMRRFKNGFEPVFQFAATAGWKFRPDAVMQESDSAFSYADQRQAGKKVGASGQGGLGGVSSTVGHKAGMAYPSNVLDIKSNADALGHAAAFPVALPAWFIRAYSDPGDVILDPFMGAGSTLIAAHQEGRAAYGTEISPAYVDLICRRYQEFTGDAPRRMLADGTTEPVDFTTEVRS